MDQRIPIDVPTGNGMRTLSTINSLRSHGHEVSLFAYTTNGSGTLVGKFKNKRSWIKSLAPKLTWLIARDSYDVYRDIKSRPRIEDIIDSFKPDIIYDASAYLKNAGLYLAKKKALPYFLEINAPTSEERAEWFGAPLGRLNNIQELNRARFASGIIVVSEVLKRILIEKGIQPEKIEIFHNGVDLDRFDGCNLRSGELRGKLGAAGPIIGFVGAIAAYHGVDRLFETARKLKEKYPGIFFWVIGPSSDLQSLQNRALELGLQNNMRFEGVVAPEDIPAYMAAFDIALLPNTAYYCSPVKLFEYGFVGVPVVAPRTAPIIEAFGEEGSVMFIDVGDDPADAIDYLLKNPDRAKNMANNMQQKVIDNYTWNIIGRRMMNFFEKRLA